MQTRDIQQQEWRKPTQEKGETILFDEPGRVLDCKADGGKYNVDYRSHSFRVLAPQIGTVMLAVKHGGGQERWPLCSSRAPMLQALERLSSDERYFTLYAMMEAHHHTERTTRARVAAEYERAFIEGRLKKRKVRGASTVKVWIERLVQKTVRQHAGEAEIGAAS